MTDLFVPLCIVWNRIDSGAVCGGAVPVSLQTAAEQNSGITVPGENQGRTDPGALADPLPARTDSDTGDGCRCKDSYRVDGK